MREDIEALNNALEMLEISDKFSYVHKYGVDVICTVIPLK